MFDNFLCLNFLIIDYKMFICYILNLINRVLNFFDILNDLIVGYGFEILMFERL